MKSCKGLRSDKTLLSDVFYWLPFCLANVDYVPQHPYGTERFIECRRSKGVNRQINAFPFGQIKNLFYKITVFEVDYTGCSVC